ncbi:MAG TPA: aminoglycoside phosphotransferase family protein [Nocardioidaceae bacterium]|nr:aminoglycoside phosphotransferase family protein [Nocardioidaceae bacterium]
MRPHDIPFEVPPAFAAFASRSDEWASWLADLPRLVRDVVGEWELTYDGLPLHGSCALILPVLTTGRAGALPAVLKFAWPHDEEQHEHLGLQVLQGNGTVRMYRADPKRHVMLLERLHADESLNGVGDLEACEIIAGFYRRIHVPAPPQLRTVTSHLDRWNEGLAALPTGGPVPRRLVEQAMALGRNFISDDASAATMVHGDLHYENVLAADREPWLVIDPKPMSGDPHYEVAPLLRNRWDDIVRSGNVRDAVRRRFHTVVDVAELEEDRARDWVVVREMTNAMWTISDAAGAGRGLDNHDNEWITRCVSIAKAVQT